MVTFSLDMAMDTMITASMIYYLSKSKTAFSKYVLSIEERTSAPGLQSDKFQDESHGEHVDSIHLELLSVSPFLLIHIHLADGLASSLGLLTTSDTQPHLLLVRLR